jgi:Ca2+-binding EF-hand superfamily protein
MAGPSEVDAAELRRAFDACDPNRDGLIDPEEFYVLLKKLDSDVSREECLLDFDAADSDGDGHIGFEEFSAWWTG